MPEEPEVEIARRLIADLALGRRIIGVDDADTPPTSPSPFFAVRTPPVSCAKLSPGVR